MLRGKCVDCASVESARGAASFQARPGPNILRNLNSEPLKVLDTRDENVWIYRVKGWRPHMHRDGIVTLHRLLLQCGQGYI